MTNTKPRKVTYNNPRAPANTKDLYNIYTILGLVPGPRIPVSSHSSHHPQEVLLVQFSLYLHNGGLKPHSFHFIFRNEILKSVKLIHGMTGAVSIS